MKTSSRLIIFEGPDGAGKTTLAKAVTERFDADYVHCGPFPQVSASLPHLYVDAMMPAVLGHRNIVMDRCWISEKPYGLAYRHGADRIGDRQRLLERLALRCSTIVIQCLPPFETVLQNFINRKGEEYLKTVDQLKAVYDWYTVHTGTDLPIEFIDPFQHSMDWNVDTLNSKIRNGSSLSHDLAKRTAGNLEISAGDVLIVCPDPADVQEGEPLYQWPMGSLAGAQCSRLLSRWLDLSGHSERSMMWVTATDVTTELLLVMSSAGAKIVTIGGHATSAVASAAMNCHIEYRIFPHPQSWNASGSGIEYPLITWLRENSG